MSRQAGEAPDARDLLRKYDLRPKRSLSQNFLIQPAAAARIAADVAELGQEVVELGPGLGALTAALLAQGCRVTACELDRDMVRVLRQELEEGPSLRIIEGDASKLDLRMHSETSGSKLVVTGNLPYHATGSILRRVVEAAGVLEGAVLMVQREVQDRLVADPGTKAYGALTVFVQAAFEVEKSFRLRPGSFYPAPRVESAVVRLRPRPAPIAEETEAFRQVVRAAFQQRRKTLRNALHGLGEPERADRALRAAAIDPRRRGETLSIEEFAALADRWAAEG